MSVKEFKEQERLAQKELDRMHKEALKKPKPNKFNRKPILSKRDRHIAGVMILSVSVVTALVLISNWFDHNRLIWQFPIILRTPVYVEKREGVEKVLPTTEQDQVVPDPSPTPTPSPKLVKTGKVSFYSHDGCLGCGDNQITASGEKFDENAMTLAIPAEWTKEIPLGSMVRVTNLDNKIAVVAKANDTGGFLKYGRIADLSKGLFEAIEAKTDKSEIKLEVL